MSCNSPGEQVLFLRMTKVVVLAILMLLQQEDGGSPGPRGILKPVAQPSKPPVPSRSKVTAIRGNRGELLRGQ